MSKSSANYRSKRQVVSRLRFILLLWLLSYAGNLSWGQDTEPDTIVTQVKRVPNPKKNATLQELIEEGSLKDYQGHSYKGLEKALADFNKASNVEDQFDPQKRLDKDFVLFAPPQEWLENPEKKPQELEICQVNDGKNPVSILTNSQYEQYTENWPRIKKYNGIEPEDKLSSGQRLLLWLPQSTPAAPTEAGDTAANTNVPPDGRRGGLSWIGIILVIGLLLAFGIWGWHIAVLSERKRTIEQLKEGIGEPLALPQRKIHRGYRKNKPIWLTLSPRKQLSFEEEHLNKLLESIKETLANETAAKSATLDLDKATPEAVPDFLRSAKLLVNALLEELKQHPGTAQQLHALLKGKHAMKLPEHLQNYNYDLTRYHNLLHHTLSSYRDSNWWQECFHLYEVADALLHHASWELPERIKDVQLDTLRSMQLKTDILFSTNKANEIEVWLVSNSGSSLNQDRITGKCRLPARISPTVMEIGSLMLRVQELIGLRVEELQQCLRGMEGGMEDTVTRLEAEKRQVEAEKQAMEAQKQQTEAENWALKREFKKVQEKLEHREAEWVVQEQQAREKANQQRLEQEQAREKAATELGELAPDLADFKLRLEDLYRFLQENHATPSSQRMSFFGEGRLDKLQLLEAIDGLIFTPYPEWQNLSVEARMNRLVANTLSQVREKQVDAIELLLKSYAFRPLNLKEGMPFDAGNKDYRLGGTIPHASPDKHNTIARVESYGYEVWEELDEQLGIRQGRCVLRPARVKVFLRSVAQDAAVLSHKDPLREELATEVIGNGTTAPKPEQMANESGVSPARRVDDTNNGLKDVRRSAQQSEHPYTTSSEDDTGISKPQVEHYNLHSEPSDFRGTDITNNRALYRQDSQDEDVNQSPEAGAEETKAEETKDEERSGEEQVETNSMGNEVSSTFTIISLMETTTPGAEFNPKIELKGSQDYLDAIADTKFEVWLEWDNKRIRCHSSEKANFNEAKKKYQLGIKVKIPEDLPKSVQQLILVVNDSNGNHAQVPVTVLRPFLG